MRLGGWRVEAAKQREKREVVRRCMVAYEEVRGWGHSSSSGGGGELKSCESM